MLSRFNIIPERDGRKDRIAISVLRVSEKPDFLKN